MLMRYALPRQGLSPRVRGNQILPVVHHHGLRSIPACAGEPLCYRKRRYGNRVYPRVCGGTSPGWPSAPGSPGLSPRVRGNPASTSRMGKPWRSIPACAGEPASGGTASRAAAVYPRVCGGTRRAGRHAGRRQGLSPRVRGNPIVESVRNGNTRSIPACAGEPHPAQASAVGMKVYPRVCGGTRGASSYHPPGKGLSPRVRGNPAADDDTGRPLRSIPACAGEPQNAHHHHPHRRVYPRVCGGTPAATSEAGISPGLSPRVRGNPYRTTPHQRGTRSIPACAGEPTTPPCRPTTTKVYPRVCGGTR